MTGGPSVCPRGAASPGGQPSAGGPATCPRRAASSGGRPSAGGPAARSRGAASAWGRPSAGGPRGCPWGAGPGRGPWPGASEGPAGPRSRRLARRQQVHATRASVAVEQHVATRSRLGSPRRSSSWKAMTSVVAAAGMSGAAPLVASAWLSPSTIPRASAMALSAMSSWAGRARANQSRSCHTMCARPARGAPWSRWTSPSRSLRSRPAGPSSPAARAAAAPPPAPAASA